MRRVALWFVSTVAVLVLLFSYRTSLGGDGGSATTVAVAPAASGSTVDGSVVDTRYGPVQVRITVADGRFTEVTVLQYPDDNRRHREINEYALPLLRTAVLEAQSADVDMISGATVTSAGYLESLQAALDAAHIS